MGFLSSPQDLALMLLFPLSEVLLVSRDLSWP